MAFKNLSHYQSFMAGRERRQLRQMNKTLAKHGAESKIIKAKFGGTCPLSGWKYRSGEEIVRFRGQWCMVRAVYRFTIEMNGTRKGILSTYEDYVRWANEGGLDDGENLEALRQSRDKQLAQIDEEIAEWEARIGEAS